MKNIKKIYLLVFLISFIGLGACQDDLVGYVPAEIDGTDQVYFPSTNTVTVNVLKGDASVDIPISRVGTEAPATVSLTVTGGEGSYSIPTSVSFAQGELKSAIKVTFDSEKLEYDDYSDIKIVISEEYTTLYGKSEYSFKIGIPSPWTSIGKATYFEDFLSTIFKVDIEEYQIEIQENDLVPGLFRLVNPYGEAYVNNEEGDWDASKDWYLEINASDPEGVYINIQEVGMDWGYGMFSMGSLAGLRLSQGKTLEEVKADGLTGTFKDGIITFPTNELLIKMADYQDGGLLRANKNGGFMVVMPGVELTDYTIDVEYGGKYFDAKDNIEGVVALINEVGKDVDKIKLALVKAEDAEDAVAGIIDGEIESVEVGTNTEKVLLPFADTPGEGLYTIVAVTFDKDGKSQGSSSASFSM